MKGIPYVSFNGNCEAAINFYHSVLGGKKEILRYKELPSDEAMQVSNVWKDKIMHSSLEFEGGSFLYFSDAWEGSPVDIGTNCTLHLQVNSEDDVYRIVKELSDGGKVTMPAEKTFWGSVYGSLIDKFGVCWGIEYELKR
jgi:PhnB protein